MKYKYFLAESACLLINNIVTIQGQPTAISCSIWETEGCVRKLNKPFKTALKNGSPATVCLKEGIFEKIDKVLIAGQEEPTTKKTKK